MPVEAIPIVRMRAPEANDSGGGAPRAAAVAAGRGAVPPVGAVVVELTRELATSSIVHGNGARVSTTSP